MHISEVMSKDVKIASPKQSIQDAARMMAEIDAGAIPVGEGHQLVGMITDRDIAVRAVAAGKPPNTPIADVMSHEVKYCLAEGRMMPPPRYLVFPSLAANIHNRRGPASISSKSSIAGDRATVSERCYPPTLPRDLFERRWSLSFTSGGMPVPLSRIRISTRSHRGGAAPAR